MRRAPARCAPARYCIIMQCRAESPSPARVVAPPACHMWRPRAAAYSPRGYAEI